MARLAPVSWGESGAGLVRAGSLGKGGRLALITDPGQCQCSCGLGLETQSVVCDLGACLLPEGLLGTQHLRPIPTLLNANIHFNKIQRRFLCTLMCEKYCHLG